MGLSCAARFVALIPIGPVRGLTINCVIHTSLSLVHMAHARHAATRCSLYDQTFAIPLTPEITTAPFLPNIKDAVLLNAVSAIRSPTITSLHLLQTSETLFTSVAGIRSNLPISNMCTLTT